MRIPRLGCLGWLLAAAVVLALGVLAFWLWFISTGDLRQVEAEARALGIPPTWAEAGFVQSDPLMLRRFTALTAIAKSTPSWTEKNFEKQPWFGEPPPPELVDFQAKIPTTTWVELAELSAELSAHPVVQYAVAKDVERSQYYQLRSVCRLLMERVLVVPLSEIPPLAQTATQTVLTIRPQTLIDHLIMLSMGSAVAGGIAKRLPELRGTAEGRMIAPQLRILREGLWRTRADGWIGELPLYLTGFDRYRPQLEWPLSWDLEQSQKELVQEAKKLTGCLARRWQRLESCRYYLRLTQLIQQAEGPADLVHRGALLPSTPVMGGILAEWGAVTEGVPGALLRDGLVRNVLYLEIVAAELDGSPMPTDYFAPAGGPLRPVMRAGKRIGWYSVNSDGVDNGGMPNKDFGFATDGKFGRPFLADPPTPRVLPKP